VVYRVARVGGRNACIYFVDGFTKDEVLLKIMQVWAGIKPEDMPEDAHDFFQTVHPLWRSRPSGPRKRMSSFSF